MDSNEIEIRKKLKKYNQEHLLANYDNLDEEGKLKLLEQIEKIDFEQMKKLYNQAISEVDFENIEIEPVDYVDKSKMTNSEKEQYLEKGIESIKDKELAVVTMAGGQGTRLGHPGPKGTYILKDGKSIFELLCDHLKDAVRKYNTFVNWYIMTSEANYHDTVQFFEDNNYFDYPKNYVFFFKQGQLHMVDEQGKILLDEEGFVKLAADGHGGTLNALKTTGILDEMKKKGHKWIFISGVDNVLANLVDPLLLGYAIATKSDIAVKSVEKTDPKEKVGVFCKKNGKIGVIEYTEITKEMANMRDDYGSLVYGDSNALLHLFNIDSLDDICEKKLPYHTAHKKSNYMNEKGEVVKSETPNAYKFESFIFDSFEMVPNVSILRVKREEEFAPLKNAEGSDSPETARKLYTDYMINTKAKENYEKWMTDKTFDDETKKELASISSNKLEIRDRFYKELDFGTAGLRGVMGAGTNRMNKYTVTKATQGLANYIKLKGIEDEGVVIGYDTRNHSREFAEYTALCLNANGIRTYLFDKEYPVPMVSYATRILKAANGIMITASHNPPEYNGYKVYGSDGAQISAPVDKEIIEEVRKIKKYSDIEMMDKEKAMQKKYYQVIGEALEKRFLKEIMSEEILNDEKIKEVKKNMKVIYTPLHGTGRGPVQHILEKQGYDNIYVVPEQELPNGNFPTVEFPNPEYVETFELSKKYADEIGANLCVATDPDADRLGAMVRDSEGNFVHLTGNEVAAILIEYILSMKSKKGELPKNGAIISTIVSTDLTKAIAKKYNVKYFETLTGFKYIGKHIREFKEDNSYEFLFGYEESYGYLYGTHARDKDSIAAVSLLLECAAYYSMKNMTLLDQLEKIYKKYGYYIGNTITTTMKGEAGEIAIKQLMEKMRSNIPESILGIRVVKYYDYKLEKVKDMLNGTEEKTTLPNSNVIYLELEDGTWIAIRPSGTEPKIKLYLETNSKDKKDAEEKLSKLEEYVRKITLTSETKTNKYNLKRNLKK